MPTFAITKEAYSQHLFGIPLCLTIVNEKYKFMFCFVKEKSQELSIRPCKSVIFKVDLYMKMLGLCTISRLNTIVNEKMRLFNSTYIKA
jgi:hypothetical protein